MIIDAHAHAAGAYSSVESIKTMAEKYQIEKILLCTGPKNLRDLAEPPNLPLKKSPDSNYILNRMLRLAYTCFLKENGDGNRYVFELKKELPDKIVQFLWVNPLDREHMANLGNRICEYRPKGIKLHQAWNPFHIDGTEFRMLVDIAGSFRLPIFIHLYSKKETWKLLRFVRNNPDAVFIVAHMAGLDIFKTEGSSLKNVYFDTSGSDRVRGSDIRNAIDAFGYEHILFGSDTPYGRIGDQIDKIDQLKLSDSVKEHIYRLNIGNMLSLVPSPPA